MAHAGRSLCDSFFLGSLCVSEWRSIFLGMPRFVCVIFKAQYYGKLFFGPSELSVGPILRDLLGGAAENTGSLLKMLSVVS